MLIAHSGGTLPFLAGRIESCVAHDAHLKKEGKIKNRRDVWEVLKNNIYLDAVIYADIGLKAAIDASGADRLMFGGSPLRDTRLNLAEVATGTDHPFFPPLEEDETEWLSVTLNSKAVKAALGEDKETAEAIMGGNAMRILGLK